MPATPGDSIYNILWKLVEKAGGTPRIIDSERDLLAKYLRAIGGTPIVGDTFYDLLAKIVRFKGGTALPGDTVWGLLVKWLALDGECRGCGDYQYDLWKHILNRESGGISPPEVRVMEGSNSVSNGQGGAIDFGETCQGDTPVTKIFTVFNDGPGILNTSGLTVPSGYAVINGLLGSIAPGGNDAFSVRLVNSNPVGIYSGNVSFSNNDSDENPFSFPVTGSIQTPLSVDQLVADGGVPWNGTLTWFWPGGDVTCTPPDPAFFGIELSQDGGAFGSIQYEAGAARIHVRASDGLPHTWIMRVAAFDGGLNRISDWSVSGSVDGPSI